jgi:hypothetical protein
MVNFPKSLDEAIAQAKEATKAALEAGDRRIQVELVIPEIALQAQKLALEFTSLFTEYNSGLKVLFPDSGAAALARRDWGEVPFKIDDIGSRFTPIDTKVSKDDRLYLIVCPSSVEVGAVEKLCNLVGDRPVVLLIPQLEDVSIVGIGYAARQVRERFLNMLVSCYYLRPLEGAAVFRCYPSQWQVWLEKGDEYELIAEQAQKPMGEALETIVIKATTPQQEGGAGVSKPKKMGILGSLDRIFKALNQ